MRAGYGFRVAFPDVDFPGFLGARALCVPDLFLLATVARRNMATSFDHFPAAVVPSRRLLARIRPQTLHSLLTRRESKPSTSFSSSHLHSLVRPCPSKLFSFATIRASQLETLFHQKYGDSRHITDDEEMIHLIETTVSSNSNKQRTSSGALPVARVWSSPAVLVTPFAAQSYRSAAHQPVHSFSFVSYPQR